MFKTRMELASKKKKKMSFTFYLYVKKDLQETWKKENESEKKGNIHPFVLCFSYFFILLKKKRK